MSLLSSLFEGNEPNASNTPRESNEDREKRTKITHILASKRYVLEQHLLHETDENKKTELVQKIAEAKTKMNLFGVDEIEYATLEALFQAGTLTPVDEHHP